MFDEQVDNTKDFEPMTLKEIYQFVKDVYNFVIPENKEPGERAFNVLDYVAMEQIGAWLKKKISEESAK